MKILHISPSYFEASSVMGGGERYAYELAKATAVLEETVFLSFSLSKPSVQTGPLKEIYVKSLASLDFFKWLEWADIIHCHQVGYHHTDWAILYGRYLRHKKVFATDLGGSQIRCLSSVFPIRQALDGLLFISDYSEKIWLRHYPNLLQVPRGIIYGGVDTKKFYPSLNGSRNRTILFVGRIVSHKGIEYLIDAVQEDWELEIVGRVYEPEYFRFLQNKAAGKKVTFLQNIVDEELIRRYRTAAAVVQPSVYTNYEDLSHDYPELLGLAALEAMACAAPVIVTDVASLPELIQDGKTGFVVPPNNAPAIRQKIEWILKHPEESREVGQKASTFVVSKYTWDQTARRCMEYYTGSKNKMRPA